MRTSVQLSKIQKELADSVEIDKCARQCGVIGDKTKLKICFLLKHYPELDVSKIAELADTSVSNASHALFKLRSVGLVDSRKESRNVYYSLQKNAFKNMISLLGEKI